MNVRNYTNDNGLEIAPDRFLLNYYIWREM